jgi:predicted N-acyltransferase
MLGNVNHLTRRTSAGFESRIFETIREIPPRQWDSLTTKGDLLARHSFVSLCEASHIENSQMRFVTVLRGDRAVGIAGLTLMKTRLGPLATGFMRSAIDATGIVAPGLTQVPVIFCGLPVSVGGSCIRVAVAEDADEVLQPILDAMYDFAAETRAALLCFKEFDETLSDRLGKPLAKAGFTDAPSLPGSRLVTSWPDLAGYRAALRSTYRRQLDSDRRAANDAGISFSTMPLSDVPPGDLYRLYLEGMDRASHRMEILPLSFFESLADLATTRAVIARKNGRIIGHAILYGGSPRSHFLLTGLDYSCLRPGQVYENLVGRVIEAALEGGAREILLGQTSYASKTRFGGCAYPLRVWLKGSRPPFGAIAPLAARWFFPKTAVPVRRVFRESGRTGVASDCSPEQPERTAA